MTLNIEHALKIAGWMEPQELEWLADQASKHKRIVEIGCYRGRSLCALSEHTSGEVWAVDRWGSGEIYPNHIDGAEAYRACMKNIADLELKNVHVCVMDSLSAARTFHVFGKFDMIFIDADHRYEEIKADILAWAPLLAEGGLLCGHDYNNAEWPGVVRAVDELIPERKIATGYIWYRP